jgi:hypothetical protein
MRKKKFFVNLGNVFLLGLVVTLVCFVIYGILIVLAIEYFNMYMTNFY